jgi:hypothetical protein
MNPWKFHAARWKERLATLRNTVARAFDGTHTTDAALLASAGSDLDRQKARTTEAIAGIAALAAGFGMGVKVWMSVQNAVIAALGSVMAATLYGLLVLMLERRILQGMPPAMTPAQKVTILLGRGAMGLVLAAFQVAPFYLIAIDGPATQEAQRLALKAAAELRSSAMERHQLNLLSSREEALEAELKQTRDTASVKLPLVVQAEDEARACVASLDNQIRPTLQRRIQGYSQRVAANEKELQSKSLPEAARQAAIARRDDAVRQIERARQELKDATARCETLAVAALDAARAGATNAQARIANAEDQLAAQRKIVATAIDAAKRDAEAVTTAVQASSALSGAKLAAVWSLLKHDLAAQLTLAFMLLFAFTVDTAAVVSKIAGGGKDSPYEMARLEKLRRREQEVQTAIERAQADRTVETLEQQARVKGLERYHAENDGATAYFRAGIEHDLELLAAEDDRDVALALRRVEAIRRLYEAERNLAALVKGHKRFEALLDAAIPSPAGTAVHVGATA